MKWVGVKGRMVNEWIDRLRSKSSHIFHSMIKLLYGFEIVQSQMQGVKNSLSQGVEDIEKSITLWAKINPNSVALVS